MEEFLRPNFRTAYLKSCRFDSGKCVDNEVALSISIRKMTPVCKRAPLCEIKFTQTTDEQVYLTRPPDKNDFDESPSLLVSNEIVREYLKIAPKVKAKKKKPTGFISRFSRLNETAKRKEGENKFSSTETRFLKRELSESGCKRTPKRMFDYRDIFSIANGKIKLKNKL